MGTSSWSISTDITRELGHRRMLRRLDTESPSITSGHVRPSTASTGTLDSHIVNIYFIFEWYNVCYWSLADSFISALDLEEKRLKKKGLSFWSIHNSVIVLHTLSLCVLVGLVYLFGWPAVRQSTSRDRLTWSIQAPFFLVQSFVAFSLLEVVNYIEHYGLDRKEIQPGKYTRVREAVNVRLIPIIGDTYALLECWIPIQQLFIVQIAAPFRSSHSCRPAISSTAIFREQSADAIGLPCHDSNSIGATSVV